MTTTDISGPRAAKLKTHRSNQRPPFERIALVLQGGGALGAYQGGVYQALAEADLHPDWVAGVSIGAVNSALIAGNPPEKRVARLREFWEIVSTAPFGVGYLPSIEIKDEFTHTMLGELVGDAARRRSRLLQTPRAAAPPLDARKPGCSQLLRCRSFESDARTPRRL